jgi:outer membrane protein OmpA-like peptidoglycan-associated protein
MKRLPQKQHSGKGFNSIVETGINKIHSLVFLFFMILTISVVGQTPSINLFEMNDFEIAHVGFNTEASDFGPCFIGDELWFSAYPSKQIKKAVEGKYGGIYYKLFKTPVDERGFTLYEPRKQVTDFNTPFHEGPVSYCTKTGELFVTLSNSINVEVEEDGLIVKKQKMRLRLVSYKKTDGVWTFYEEMPFNDKVYSVGQPSITSSGDTLFFTSDNPALSSGGTDIMMVTRTDGKWGQPNALSSAINTPGNEMFPFYHPSGILIFTSDDRPGNKGGLDLYSSDLLSTGFTPALPLTQFNSKSDDFGLIIHPSNESGYFVSNRPGQNGGDDIYMVKIKKTYMQLTGKVVDDFTGQPVKGAEVTLYSCDGKKIDNGIVGDNGQFIFKVLRGGCYVAGATAKGYPENRKAFGKEHSVDVILKHDRSLQLVILDYETHNPVENVRINLDNSPAVQLAEDGYFYKKLTTEREIPVFVTVGGYLNQHLIVNTTKDFYTEQTILMMKLDLNKSFILDSIRFEKDDWSITPRTQEALDNFIILLNDNPAIKIEICTHTDSRGDDQYAMTLTRRRSESLVDYLIKKGIPKQRLAARGYGETQLLNHCSNGVECTEEEHALNNRTEFKIVGFVK